MGFLSLGWFVGTWGALVPDIQRQINISDAELGRALMCLALGALPAMVVAGRLADRLGSWVLPASMFVFAGSVYLAGLSWSLMSLSLSLLLVGACSGALDVIMNARVSTLETQNDGVYMHLAHALFAIPYCLSALAAGALRWLGCTAPTIFLISTVLLGFLAICAISRDELGTNSDHSQTPSIDSAVRFVVLTLGFVAMAAFLSEQAMLSWSALHLERSLGSSPFVGSLGPATVGLALAVGRLSAQLVVRFLGLRQLLIAASVLSATFVFGFAFAPNAWLGLVCLFLAGVAFSVIVPSVLSLAGRVVPPSQRGRTVGAITFVGYTGFFIGPACIGLLAENFGLRWALSSISVLLIMSGPAGVLAVRLSSRLSVPLTVGR
jgi:MFS family permease